MCGLAAMAVGGKTCECFLFFALCRGGKLVLTETLNFIINHLKSIKMNKTLLNFSVDDKNNLVVDIPDRDVAVLSIPDHIWERLLKKDTDPLSLLLAVVVHTLARDLSGGLERDFVDNLKDMVPKYRESYRQQVIQKEKMS